MISYKRSAVVYELVIWRLRFLWWRHIGFGRPALCRGFYGGPDTVWTFWRAWVQWSGEWEGENEGQ